MLDMRVKASAKRSDGGDWEVRILVSEDFAAAMRGFEEATHTAGIAVIRAINDARKTEGEK